MNAAMAAAAAVLLIVAPFATSIARAHTVWLDDAGAPGRFALQFGGHAGKTEPYDAGKLRGVRAYDAAGRTLPVTRQDKDGRVHFMVDGASLVTVAFDNGYWSRTSDGRSVNRPMTEVTDAVSGVHAVKYHKRILSWSPVVQRPTGQPFELLPMTGTMPLAGRPLRIRVLIDGQPAAGVPLAFGEEGREVVTDADGVASLTPRAGRNRIWAGRREAVIADPATRQRSIEYSLVFDAS